MKKKFVASSKYNYLGKVYDTKEEAQRAARGFDFHLDSMTGYSTAFNCEVEEVSSVIEIEDRVISVEEYLAMQAELKREKKIFEEKIAQMEKEFYAKYDAKKSAYINLNTPYGDEDTIRLVTRRASGRKRVIEGNVCGVHITDEGEIRPSIRWKPYPMNEPIISIEVLEVFDPKKIVQSCVCQNCKFYNGKRYEVGYCTKHDIQVYGLKKNQHECYVRDPEKKK